MQTSLRSRVGRLMICGSIAFASVTTACSDDGDDKSGTDDPVTTESAATSDWCSASRSVSNASPGQQLELAQAAAELAPEDLKPDFDIVIEFLEFREENPSDAVGISERQAALPDAFSRITAALQEECDLTVDLMN